MPETLIDSTEYGNIGGTAETTTRSTQPSTDTFQVEYKTTDGAGEQKETEWINPDCARFLGYYKTIPELQIAIDALADWTTGKGLETNELTMLKLLDIRGCGIDTFETILENLVRTYQIYGDAFAEIIRTEEGELINLKPLDPSTIKIVANSKGIITRYEQVSKIQGQANKKFSVDEILHLARNRGADEIHGVSLIPSVEWIILARNEAMDDMKTLMHRHVKPFFIHHLDTDDPTEIASFKAKMDAAMDKGENIYVPKGVVVPELISVAPNSTLNPLSWIELLNQYFSQATGVPDIIIGNSRALTEAAGKIVYLAFQQRIEKEQRYIEGSILAQLNLEIKLKFPASLQNELLSENKKEGEMQGIEQADLTAGQPQ